MDNGSREEQPTKPTHGMSPAGDTGGRENPPAIAVLYVDDEPALLEPTRLTLEKNGHFTVDTTKNAQEALEKIRMRHYDVVVSDYQMPEINGIQFLRRLRESGNPVPFIIFTGKGREDAVIDAYNAGADFYLAKGGDPKAMFLDLTHKIEQVVTRRRAEKALRASEQRLHAIIDGSPTPQFVINREHEVIYWNKALEKYSGIPASEIQGTTLAWKAFYPEKRPLLADLLVDDAIETIPSLYQGRYQAAKWIDGAFEITDFFPKFGRRGGSWLHFSAIAIRDDQGEIIGALETLIDITDRKKAEEELRSSEQYLKTIFQSVQTGLLIIDPDTHTIVDANPASIAMIGLPRDEIVGNECHIFVCPAEKGKCPITDLHKNVDHAERILITGSGGKIPVIKTVIPVVISGKSYLLETIQDITDRKRAEDALQNAYQELEQKVEERTHELSMLAGSLQNEIAERNRVNEALTASEEKYRSLVEYSLDGIIITDFTGKLLFSNRAAGLIVDAPDYEKLIGKKNVLDFVAPESKAKVLLDFGKVALGIDAYLVSYKLLTEKKREVWVECIGKKIPFGDSSAMLVSMRDITERRILQNEVAASLKEKEILLKEIHHRVKNNMQVISSLLSLQVKQMKDTPSREAIRESQNRVMSIALVHEKLYQSKSLAEIEYHDYLKKIAENLLQSYGIPPGKVRIEIHGENIVLPIGRAIPISLMINELLSNSLKYAFPGDRKGVITVDFHREGEREVLIVRDDGIGIPAGIEIGHTETLGLQLVSSLAGQALGTITLNRDRGTEFRIEFENEPVTGEHHD
jgi:PAS domain S-box-containing protein